MSVGTVGRGGTDRGQTTIDFVVGITLFLVTTTVIIGLLPEILLPYDDSSPTAVAERVSDDLTRSLLASQERGTPPGTLDSTCTVAFFEGQNEDVCRFNGSAAVTDRLGISSTYRVNVTLAWNTSGSPAPEILCHDGSEITVCGSDPLAVGPPPGDASAAVVQRGVVIDSRQARLTVRVWDP